MLELRNQIHKGCLKFVPLIACYKLISPMPAVHYTLSSDNMSQARKITRLLIAVQECTTLSVKDHVRSHFSHSKSKPINNFKYSFMSVHK